MDFEMGFYKHFRNTVNSLVNKTTVGAQQSGSLWEVVIYGKNQKHKLKLN